MSDIKVRDALGLQVAVDVLSFLLPFTPTNSRAPMNELPTAMALAAETCWNAE